MSEERKIKHRRSKVDKRANVSSEIQQMELETAWNYFITAKIGEGIRDRTRDDYLNTCVILPAGLTRKTTPLSTCTK
ncbi:hypothetical protein [Peribacillus muralis]|uniref:hypothetical protein n=1 Tax=Peribacillus muralis TaxID=264697 RepID=UPI003D019E89